MTAAARIRKADVKRFFTGAADAGVQFSKVEFDPTTGRLVGFVGTVGTEGGPNEWDDVLPGQ